MKPRLANLVRGVVCWAVGCDLSRGQFCQRCDRFVP